MQETFKQRFQVLQAFSAAGDLGPKRRIFQGQLEGFDEEMPFCFEFCCKLASSGHQLAEQPSRCQQLAEAMQED